MEKVKHYKKGEEIWLKNINTELSGDMRFTFYDMDKLGKDDKMFVFWINTNFLHLHQPFNTTSTNSLPHRKILGTNDIVIRIPKMELDKAIKDKKHQSFDADFYIDLIFEVKEQTVYSEPKKFVYEGPEQGKEIFGELQQFAKTEASSKDKEKARKLYDQGREFFSLKQYTNAVTCFSNAILIDGSFEEAYMSRGLANMNLKRYPEAIYDFTSVLNIIAKGGSSSDEMSVQDSILLTLRAFHSRGKCQAKMKEYDEAIKDFDSTASLLTQQVGSNGVTTGTSGNSASPFLDSLYQTFFRVYLDRALMNDALQKYNDCVVDYTNYIKYMDPLCSSMNAKLREGKISANKYEQFLFELFQSFYNKAIAIAKIEDYRNKDAQIFHDLSKAIEYIEKMSDPINSPDAANFAQVYLTRAQKQANKESAIEDYLKCLMYDKTNKKANTQLAILLYEQKEYKRAIIYFSKLINDDPTNVKTLTNRAICYMKIDQYERAIEDFVNAQKLAPENITLFIQCGRCYRKKHAMLEDQQQAPQKEFESCEHQFTNALDLILKRKKALTPSPTTNSSSTSPNTPPTLIKDDELKTLYFERAMTRLSLKKYDDAVLDFSHCLELDPSHQLALFNRAYTRQKHLKQYEKALLDYEAVLVVNSGDIRARIEKGSCLYYLKRDEEAKMEWQLVLKKDPNNEAAKLYLAQLSK